MSTSYFRKKDAGLILKEAAEGFSDGEHHVSGLRRILGVRDLTALGIAAIIGAGIFSTVGRACYDGGPGVIILFIITGIACGFSALCYAEFASILPVSGSAYAYSYGTVGEFFAWFIGWNLILEYMMGATTVAVSWSKYFIKLLHLSGIHDIPLWLITDPVTAKEEALKLGIAAPSFSINLPAGIIVWLVTYILFKGIYRI